MSRRAIAAALLLAAGPLSAAPPRGAAGHPLDVAQPHASSGEALVVVEIPAGGTTKFELDGDGRLFVDRFLETPAAYPANYGSMPRTLAGDGDALDALVLSRTPLPPGVRLRFRPIGVLRMVDAGEADEKVIGVPADGVDAGYARIRDIADLADAERTRIELFFRLYKAAPGGENPVRLQGFGDAGEARRVIEAARKRFEASAAD